MTIVGQRELGWLASDEGRTSNGARRGIDRRNAITVTAGAAWNAGVDLSGSVAVDQIVYRERDSPDEIRWSIERVERSAFRCSRG